MIKMPIGPFLVLLVVIAALGLIAGTMVKHPGETDHLAGDVIRGALGMA